MQLPNSRTPTEKCEQLSLFASTMLRKFTQHPQLASYAAQLEAAIAPLSQAQAAYEAAVKALVVPRVEVVAVDYFADQGVRALFREAERADGGKGGAAAAALFPDGVTPIVKPVGPTEVRALRELEARLDNVASSFAGATAEKEKIAGLRKSYEAALEARLAAGQKASALRHARDLARESFLDVYAAVASRVKADFPRDRAMQNLFFDVVRDDAGDDGADQPPVG